MAFVPVPHLTRQGSHARIEHADRRDRRATGRIKGRPDRRWRQLYQLHATEYAYGGMEGIGFTMQSIRALRKERGALALPSYSEVIDDVDGDIERLERRLIDCVRLGSGLDIARFPSLRRISSLTLLCKSSRAIFSGEVSGVLELLHRAERER
jgi:hypothetical protein